MASPDELRLQYKDPNQYRLVEKKLVQRTIEETLRSLDQGMDPNVAAILPILTLLEGSGHPHGIDKGQDIAVKRLLGGKSSPEATSADKFGRIPTDGIDKARAQQLIAHDKQETLKSLGLDSSAEAVAKRFNVGDPDYTNKLSRSKEAIDTIFGNYELRNLLQPLLEEIAIRKKLTDKNYRPSLTPLLDQLMTSKGSKQ